MGRPWRAAASALAVGAWAVFVALAVRTSRYPVVLHRYSKEYAALLAIVLAMAAIVTTVRAPRVFAMLWARRHALIWFGLACPVLVFGAVETAMRAFNLLGSNFYGEVRRYMTVLAPDNRLYFKNPASFRGTFGSVEIATNELGLRERPLQPHVPGEKRILVLGDSVAFGWGVKVEDAFPSRLEAGFRQSGAAAVEAVNSGVPGYNTTQELRFLQTYGDRLQPDLVLLLYVDNDIDAIDPARVHMGILADPRKDPLGAIDYFLSTSHLYFMMRHLIPLAVGAARVSLAERRQSAGWRESMQSLDEMARDCRARGVPLAVFHFRMLDDPISHGLNDAIEDRAEADGFYLCDTLPWFAGRNIRRLTNSFIDTHPNAEGHRILAEGMAHFLLTRSLAPAVAGAETQHSPRNSR
jgi:lysophospholipase L1-like esterase